MGASGLLDVGRRVEKAVVESLLTWNDLTDLLSNPTAVGRKGQASARAVFPHAWVQGYNFAEYGLHTGNYLGGIRLGGVTYKDEDPDEDVVKSLQGAFLSWAQQSGLLTILNNTASAQAAGSEVWFFAVELDLQGQGQGAGGGQGGGGGRGRGGGFALGPGGNCVCPSCGAQAAHQRGTPCYQSKCPKCGAQMTRPR